MMHFTDKVAVVTGAASGIGLGLAERCAAEGMQVVLADVEEQVLEETTQDLAAMGARVLSVPTDVSDPQAVEDLAKKSFTTFGAVHLLCNNAGVAADGSIWESTLNDWQWVMGVNLWGVIHGIRSFVPVMLDQHFECHIVNTASIAGLTSPFPSASYGVTKHAVVALSEQLFYELSQREAQIYVSVLCPGYVNTRIMDSARNRPLALTDESELDLLAPDDEERVAAARKAISEGMSPAEIADCVFKAIVSKDFWIRPHSEIEEEVRIRLENIAACQNPS